MDKDRALAFATATTDGFVPGTLVMLHSFLKENPWFRGDILVLHDGLSERNVELLGLLSPRVRCVRIGDALRTAIPTVLEAIPELAPLQARFYSLDLFAQQGYDAAIFCDSDILIRGSVEEALKGDAAFRAVDARVSHVLPDPDAPDAPRVRSLNSGFFVVDRALLSPQVHEELLALTTPATFDGMRATLADQVVLNVRFAESFASLDPAYNYLLSRTRGSQGERMEAMLAAKVLHFVGPRNPWMPEQVLERSTEDPVMVRAFGLWLSSYAGCLESLSVASTLRG